MKALLSVIAVGLLLVAATSTAGTNSEHGRFALRGVVDRTVDGDTIIVRLTLGGRERVRLIGIDTPELSSRACFASQARRRASPRPRKACKAYWRRNSGHHDRYDRLLAYVLLPSGKDLGRQLLAEGFGKVYVYRDNFQRIISYRAASEGQKAGNRGLWKRCARAAPARSSRRPRCHRSYPTVCIRGTPPDLDCPDVPYRSFRVRHHIPDADPHRFDGNRDGVGCETPWPFHRSPHLARVHPAMAKRTIKSSTSQVTIQATTRSTVGRAGYGFKQPPRLGRMTLFFRTLASRRAGKRDGKDGVPNPDDPICQITFHSEWDQANASMNGRIANAFLRERNRLRGVRNHLVADGTALASTEEDLKEAGLVAIQSPPEILLGDGEDTSLDANANGEPPPIRKVRRRRQQSTLRYIAILFGCSRVRLT